MTSTQRMFLGAIVAIIGLLGVIAGIIYLTEAAKSLPSILGPLHNEKGHRTGHGIAALAVGIVLLLGGGGFALYNPRRH